MNNYSAIYNDSDLRSVYACNITGHFNREKFNENVKKYSLDNWKEEIKRGMHIWELSYKEEDYDEDNDTEEEDEEKEEFDA
jgi:hypothetical protein